MLDQLTLLLAVPHAQYALLEHMLRQQAFNSAQCVPQAQFLPQLELPYAPIVVCLCGKPTLASPPAKFMCYRMGMDQKLMHPMNRRQYAAQRTACSSCLMGTISAVAGAAFCCNSRIVLRAYGQPTLVGPPSQIHALPDGDGPKAHALAVLIINLQRVSKLIQTLFPLLNVDIQLSMRRGKVSASNACVGGCT